VLGIVVDTSSIVNNDEKLRNMGVWEAKICEIWEFAARKFGKYGSYAYL
jgi:hypothetical protein